MPRSPARQAPLPDRVARQRALLSKLERDGYRCEVLAARRMLRALLAKGSPRTRGASGVPGPDPA